MIRINDTQEFNGALSAGVAEVGLPNNTNLLLFADVPSPDYIGQLSPRTVICRRP
jgi:hypothetical protein